MWFLCRIFFSLKKMEKEINETLSSVAGGLRGLPHQPAVITVKDLWAPPSLPYNVTAQKGS